MKAPLLLLPLAFLPLGIWMIRAHLRNEHHIAARLAAVASFTALGYLTYFAYLGKMSPIIALGNAIFATAMFSLAITKKRFHAPR